MATQAIIVNWRRPSNVSRILKALAQQSVKFDKIILVDNGFEKHHVVREGLRYVSNHYRFKDDGLGPVCRFAPALLDYRPEYTLFIDDDMLPGPRMHETLIKAARELNDHFSTIGEIGRIYGRVPHAPYSYGFDYEYKVADVRRSPTKLVQVDLTCRAHFVKTRNVVEAICLRNDLVTHCQWAPSTSVKTGTPEDWTRHDDILLCCGIQRSTNARSFLLRSGLSDEKIESEKLPDPESMSGRPGHIESRQALINLAKLQGWRSLIEDHAE